MSRSYCKSSFEKNREITYYRQSSLRRNVEITCITLTSRQQHVNACCNTRLSGMKYDTMCCVWRWNWAKNTTVLVKTKRTHKKERRYWLWYEITIVRRSVHCKLPVVYTGIIQHKSKETLTKQHKKTNRLKWREWEEMMMSISRR